MESSRKPPISLLRKCLCTIIGILAASMVMAIQTASAQATSTRMENYYFDIFIACLGETVSVTTTLHLVNRDGLSDEHGNQQHATAVGLTTGNEYVVGGSPSNVVPVGDGEYLYHFSFVGKGRDAAKFSLTAIGSFGQPPTRVIESHCNLA